MFGAMPHGRGTVHWQCNAARQLLALAVCCHDGTSSVLRQSAQQEPMLYHAATKCHFSEAACTGWQPSCLLLTRHPILTRSYADCILLQVCIARAAQCWTSRSIPLGDSSQEPQSSKDQQLGLQEAHMGQQALNAATAASCQH